MEEKKVIFAPNLIVVGVDDYQYGNFSGQYWDQYSEGPHKYDSAIQLLTELDQFFDEIDFPQRAMVPRSFKVRNIDFAQKFNKNAEKKLIMKQIEGKGDKGTFIVQVKYRQNATWQGQVVWAEENKKVHFRSALELLQLMDSALNQGGELFEGGEDADVDAQD